MKYKAIFRDSAEKELARIPERDKKRILEKIRRLEDDPFPHDRKKIMGQVDVWRIRSGNYRVIYNAPDEHGMIDILSIGHRRTVYKKL